eukprot:scaffold1594_cov401-Prasinococcus_capsulatus_cf.AAC.4
MASLARAALFPHFGCCWSGDLYAVESALCMHAYALTRDSAPAAIKAMETCRNDRGATCACDRALSLQTRGAGALAPAYAISPNLMTQFRGIGFSSTSEINKDASDGAQVFSAAAWMTVPKALCSTNHAVSSRCSMAGHPWNRSVP